jgi:hypothetical protein
LRYFVIAQSAYFGCWLISHDWFIMVQLECSDFLKTLTHLPEEINFDWVLFLQTIFEAFIYSIVYLVSFICILTFAGNCGCTLRHKLLFSERTASKNFALEHIDAAHTAALRRAQ